ncbi:MAG: hypothetical protein ACLUNS_09175 [Alistipes shahii]
MGLEAYKEFVHFGLTSQDINNTAIPLSLKEAHDGGLLPCAGRDVRGKLGVVRRSSGTPCRCWHARTDSPPRRRSLGKEFMVFVERHRPTDRPCSTTSPCTAKFGGATGNFNAHRVGLSRRSTGSISPTASWARYTGA